MRNYRISGLGLEVMGGLKYGQKDIDMVSVTRQDLWKVLQGRKGWRLPEPQEFKILYEIASLGTLNLKHQRYWTARSSYIGGDDKEIFLMNGGEFAKGHRDIVCNVALVRSY